MKFILTFLFTLFVSPLYLYGVHSIESPKQRNCTTREIVAEPVYDCRGFLCSDDTEDSDPLEPLNRCIFLLNEGLDYLLIEPIAGVYSEVVPEYVRVRISNILRNLGEPVVLANNLLQGELEDARGTIWRFVFNSTIGVVGIFDVSTDLGIPYKKQDLGLTFASWGVTPGPYLVLPVLGPSTVRDAWGRIGDFAVDPINWLTFGTQSTTRSAVQILDAKTDNIEITSDIKKNAIDYYASTRSWYMERRRSLALKKEDQADLESPQPDDEE